MAEYIEREALKEELLKKGFYPAIVAGTLERLPAADVVEVRHGKWERGWQNGDIYAYCTACKRRMNYNCYGYAYCPLCGAEMGGKDGAE